MTPPNIFLNNYFFAHTKVTMDFEDNSADVGPVVFMSDSEVCEWNSVVTPFFSSRNFSETWVFMNMTMR